MDQATLINLIVAAVAGIVTGHGTGAAAQNTSLGPVGNTATGAVGGVLGGLLGALVPALQQINAGSAANGASVGGGAIGGIILTAIIGYIKNQMGGSNPQ